MIYSFIEKKCLISFFTISTFSSGSQAYPGDLVLTTGHSLRRQSPPLVNGNSSDHYGSEGSLIDTATPVKDERTKTLERKPKTSIFNIDRLKCAHQLGDYLERKKAIMPELEYVLQTLVPTEFKDERLASKRHLHWQDLIDNPEEDLSNISEQEKSRRDAVWEIFTNECTFLVDHLMVLKHCFMEPLLKCQVEGLLMDIEPPKLFGNLNELCDLSYRFCRDFYNQLKSLPMSEFASVSCLCDCLDIMTWYSRDGDIYHSYLLNYRSALTYLDILRNTLDDYALYEKFCEQDPRCNKLRLSDLLIAPMQHWTRLPLILERVRKYTTNQSDIDRLNSSTEKVVCSLKSLENKMEWLKTFERVKEIEKQLIWPTISEIDSKAFIPDTLKGLLSVQPTKHILDDKIREITFEGPLLLTEKDRNVDVYVFLFTDFLLFTKVKKKVRGRMSIIEKDGFYQVLRQPIPVHSLSVHDIGAAESNSSGMKNLFVIVQRNSFQQIVGVFSLQAHTSLGKQKWLSHLRDNKEKSRAEINNNGSQLSELASRQKTFRDMHEYGSYSSLLKHSQVLPLEAKTSHTLPRNHRNHIYAAPSTSSQSAAELTTDSNPPSTRQKRILDRSKTLSAGCLVSDRSFSLANGSPIK
ncbi:PLEKHG7 [Bugula neritina]|uniref:PLEKHG7 n=1 Tax=Bugula neritina TaxID=10212 RepID=A0A7J7JA81_BUGNE|nr:PLEKHG7 [Bugula neritina]